MMWVLAALTMTVGNLIALRQTNVVRLFAYSSVAQAGFILAPLAVAGDEPGAVVNGRHPGRRRLPAHLHGDEPRGLRGDHRRARKTRSGEIATWGGLFEYAPGLAVP